MDKFAQFTNLTQIRDRQEQDHITIKKMQNMIQNVGNTRWSAALLVTITMFTYIRTHSWRSCQENNIYWDMNTE